MFQEFIQDGRTRGVQRLLQLRPAICGLLTNVVNKTVIFNNKNTSPRVTQASVISLLFCSASQTFMWLNQWLIAHYKKKQNNNNKTLVQPFQPAASPRPLLTMKIPIFSVLAFFASTYVLLVHTSRGGKHLDSMYGTKGISQDPCYNQEGRPIRCIPDFVNAAFGKRVVASSTCGAEPENYCKSSTDKNGEIIRWGDM